jgi:hypothetical protein
MPNGAPAGPAAQAAGRPGDAAPGAPRPGDAAPGAPRPGDAAPGDAALGDAGPAARLVFFQHDEVIVHCPEGMAGAVADAVASAAAEAGQLVFGPTPVRFPVTTAVVASYAEAK